ncbi:hypothetical protein COUCH_19920 [Couchioplanes caeruleus]|uniref:hypothetical protein n=1 Tax=Couchioplanes caeruleus TaxID=56438 RepID=UPI0020BDF9CB|nr:hypothetical protein [Couchioplanes caeruleus]UQU61332.1 hypothetical protein COUCH_19920 [Couchioplanes caeruleus]
MPPNRSLSRVRAAGLAAVAAVLLVSAAACGGGGDPQASAGGSGGFTAYTECLQKNGVTVTMPSGGPAGRPEGGFPSGMPRPSGSGGTGGFRGGLKPAGVDDATWQKAQTACASVRPSGRPDGGGRGNGMNAAYRTCLQDHGVTLGASAPATGDPRVKQAMEACKVLAPAPSSRPSPSS